MLEPLGVRCIPVCGRDTAALTRAIAEAEALRLVFVETPGNPTLQMVDIGAAGAAAQARMANGSRGESREPALGAGGNTLIGPALQHPPAVGAGLAGHSPAQ